MSNENTILKQKRGREFPRIRYSEITKDQTNISDSLIDSIEENKESFKKISEKDFIYDTPAPNKIRKLIEPSTPKKKKVSTEFDEIKIKGKNLLELFKSL